MSLKSISGRHPEFNKSEDASDEMFISHQFIQTLNTDETRIFCHLAEGRPADKGCQVCVRLRAF